MKCSNYNYFIENEKYTYWYNGLEHTYFRLPIELGRKIKRIIDINPSDLQLSCNSFYNKLLDNGFIIEDDKDELAIIRERHQLAVNSKDYMLTVMPTLNCNFKCWYCIQDHIPSLMNAETIDKVKAHINYILEVEKITSLHLEWFGGEPFMFFKKVVLPISEYAIEKCKEYNVPFYNSATTNAYYLIPETATMLKELKFEVFQITLDGPKEFHDKVKYQKDCPSAFQRVLYNIENILNSIENAMILLRINYTRENLSNVIVQQVNQFISEKNRCRVRILPKKVWQEKVDLSLFQKVKSLMLLFEKSGYIVTKLDLILNFVTCYAERKCYNAINYNGDIVKCTACNDLYSEAPGKLNSDGTITWRYENFDEMYFKDRFEIPECIACQKLPICMGMCPRNYNKNQSFYCKLEGSNIDVEEAIVDYINSEYEE